MWCRLRSCGTVTCLWCQISIYLCRWGAWKHSCSPGVWPVSWGPAVCESERVLSVWCVVLVFTAWQGWVVMFDLCLCTMCVSRTKNFLLNLSDCSRKPSCHPSAFLVPSSLSISSLVFFNFSWEFASLLVSHSLQVYVGLQQSKCSRKSEEAQVLTVLMSPC